MSREKHSIKRVSIINADTGIEIYQRNYEPSFFLKNDNQLISGFISALIQFSREIVKDDIEEMVFSNSQLYIKRFSTVFVVLMTPLGISADSVSPIMEKLGQQIEEDFSEQELDFLTPKLSQKIEELMDTVLDIGVIIPPAPKKKMKHAPKIIVAGLRKAGKTTAIRSFFDSWDKEKLQSIRPTVDYSIFNSFLDEIKSELTIFDLGGQDQYIKKHLTDLSKWKGASAIIFVVDMHKPDEFGAANQYLNEIMSIARELGESPFIGLFAHKYDPDKVGDLQPSLAQLLKTFKGLFKWSKYSVFMSSIYDDSLYLAFMRTLIRIVPRDLMNRILGSAIFFETQNRVWKTISEDLSPEQESHEFWNKIIKLSIPYGENLANKIFREWLSGQMDETVNKEITELIRIKIEDIAGGMKANITLPREGSSLLIVAVIEGLLTGLGNVFGFSRIIRLHVDQTPGDIATSWGLYEF